MQTPIIVGLAGKAGAGKTVTARGMAKQGTIGVEGSQELLWDHSFFALPLYEFVSHRRNIMGPDASQRQLYETMKTLLKMFPSPLYGGPSFDELVEMTYEIVEAPMPLDSDEKPRTFMQTVGRLCRDQQEDVFARYIEGLFKRRGIQLMTEYNRDGELDYNYIMLVSDLRYQNEAEMILRQKNGMVIKLEASQDVLTERILKRDKKAMTPEQMAHESEQGIDFIPYTATLDTDNLSIKDQVLEVRTMILDHFKLQRDSTHAN